MALAHRVHLDGHIPGSIHLQQAQWIVVEDKAVGVVVGDDYAVAASEVDQPLESLSCRPAPGRHMGIVDPH